ncbi:YpoC family protein [Alteribacillus sp. HJP-4]|uniref:YpoC family protein n=1 Tax=Alteribacillus sp. HJP-4 TaxID=2775394 RepID=UPI0035CD0260
MPELLIPPSLVHPPFYNTNSLNSGDIKSTEPMFEIPFYAEILAENNKLENLPWLHKKMWVPAYINRWEEERDILQRLFKNENRQEARPYMIIGIARFINILFWMNNLKTQTSSAESLEALLPELNKTPVNSGERLAYALNNPDHYHSYIQLRELYEETRKQFAVIKMKES